MYALLDNTAKRRDSLKRAGYESTPISVPFWPGFLDFYGFGMSCLFLPIAIVLWCIITILAIIPALLGKLYVFSNPRPLDRFEGKRFNVYLLLISPFAALVGFIAYFWWVFVYLFSLLLASPVAFVRLLIGRGHVITNNYKLLQPYWRAGVFSYSGAVRAILGQADRHGFVSFLIGSPFLGSFASSICHVPILKYCWSTNPLLYELEVVHINQWSPKVEQLTAMQIKHKTHTKVGRSKHRTEEVAILDSARFTPHYPFGESLGVQDHLELVEGDEAVVGSQYLNYHPKLFGYTRSVYVKDNEPLKSERGEQGIFKVYLDYFGYHFLTGYVELNVDKNNGVEHPMWIIVPKSSKLGRDLYEFANILFVPYLREAIYATLVLRDDDERDKRMSLVAIQKRASLNQITVSTDGGHSKAPVAPEEAA